MGGFGWKSSGLVGVVSKFRRWERLWDLPKVGNRAPATCACLGGASFSQHTPDLISPGAVLAPPNSTDGAPAIWPGISSGALKVWKLRINPQLIFLKTSKLEVLSEIWSLLV